MPSPVLLSIPSKYLQRLSNPNDPATGDFAAKSRAIFPYSALARPLRPTLHSATHCYERYGVMIFSILYVED